MPIATYTTARLASIDGSQTGSNFGNSFEVGILTSGGSKTVRRRALTLFDLFTASQEGHIMQTTDIVTAAELWMDVLSLVGVGGFAATTERLSQTAWVQNECTWVRYSVGNNWTVPGGDVATPPAALPWTSPTTTGDQRIASGLHPHVIDAIQNRAGQMHNRWMQSPETFADNYFRQKVQSGPPRLIITYEDTAPSSIDDPAPATIPVVRPALPFAPLTPGVPAPPVAPASRKTPEAPYGR